MLAPLIRVVRNGGSKDRPRGRINIPSSWIGKEVIIAPKEAYIVIPKEEYCVMTNIMKNYKALLKVMGDILSKGGRKMFNVVSRTWNPVTGCLHGCRYCWARRLVETKLKNSRRYQEGFKPRLNKEEFNVKFKEGELVFVSDMGDLFGDFIPKEWILKVIEHIRKFPKTYFLFLTKNPERYFEFLDVMPDNVILGATIETNRDDLYLEEGISGAPLPSKRYEAMKKLDWDKKFISIEPILDFDLDTFVQWIREISPFMVYLGYDNYGNKLPEPPLAKTLKLIDELSNFTLVIRKTIRSAWNETLLSTIVEGGCNMLSFDRRRRSDKVKEIMKKVKHLYTFSQTFLKDNLPHYKAHPWTLAKLLILGGWCFVYTAIIPKHFKKYWYIDLLAGTGTIEIEPRKIFPGSAFIAHVMSVKPFSEYYFIELDDTKYAALETRVRRFEELYRKSSIIRGDCNIIGPNIAGKMDRYTHALVFIDNEGLDVKWQTVESFLKKNADIIILFQTKEISRAIPIISSNPQVAKRFTEFFGQKVSPSSKADELLEMYKEKLKMTFEKYRGKECFVSSIRIGDKKYYYDLILVCRRGPYIKAWEHMVKAFNWQDVNTLKKIIEIVAGKIKSIEEYLYGLTPYLEGSE